MRHRSKSLQGVALATTIAWLLSSCATSNTEPAATATTVQPPQPTARPAEVPLSEQIDALLTNREEIVERGSGQFLQAPTISPTGGASGDIELRFDGVDISEFVNIVLGDLLQVNYVIDPAVSGTVTINTTTPITEDDLLPVFEEVLAANNASLAISSGIYRVVPRDLVTRMNTPLSITGQTSNAGYSTQVFPLQFISAIEMQGILEKVVSTPDSIRIDSARNIVIVSGSPAEIAAIYETITIFDVDWLRGMSIGLYPLDNVAPDMLEGELIEVLNATTGGVTEEILGGIVRLVPLERLSSLLVVSSTPTALREIEIWIRRLDQPGQASGKRLYVYPMENAKASELAAILTDVFDSRSSQSATATTSGTLTGTASTATGIAPGLATTRIGSAPTPGATGTTATSSLTRSTGSDNSLTLASGESIEIIADDVRNALVILATPQDYRMVEAALQKLDIVPLQVLIEASILAVQLNDDLSFGVEWFFRNSLNGGEDTGTGLLDLGSAGISALAPGFSYTVVNSADEVRFALNALATESELNVLSSPSLMVLDNQTATINVGDEIPVPTRQSISNVDATSPTVNEISYRQTGVSLNVTPRVSNSGLVTMEIQQEVSTAASTTTSNIDAPTIQNRQIESVVAINSGETIVLGGLIQDQESNGNQGIPGLSRIPGLGRLFGRKIDEFSRTELLVLITPRVVRNADEARLVTDEFRRKLPQLRELSLQHQSGTEDESL